MFKLISTWLLVIIQFISYVYPQDSRIVGGFDVDPPFKYSWLVTINRYGEYWCGGVLIKDNLVLTAAHCMGGAIGPLINFKAQLHRHNLTLSLEEEQAKEFNLINRWVADGYDRDYLYNDLAIVELDTYNHRPTDVIIDTELTHHEGYRVSALGWGALHEDRPHHPILQEVWLPLTSRSSCQSSYLNQGNYTILPSQICAGFIGGGHDSCQGDSGGPLFTLINNRPLLIGITSNGFSCARPMTPGIYTRVAHFSQWILGVMAGTIDPTPDYDPFP